MTENPRQSEAFDKIVGAALATMALSAMANRAQREGCHDITGLHINNVALLEQKALGLVSLFSTFSTPQEAVERIKKFLQSEATQPIKVQCKDSTITLKKDDISRIIPDELLVCRRVASWLDNGFLSLREQTNRNKELMIQSAEFLEPTISALNLPSNSPSTVITGTINAVEKFFSRPNHDPNGGMPQRMAM